MYKCVHPSSISSLAMRRHCYTLRGSVLSFLGRSLLSFVSTVCQLCCFRCYASCRLHDRLCHTGFMLSRISSCWLSSVVWHFWYKSKYYTGMQPAVSTWLTAFQTFEYWMQNFVVTFFCSLTLISILNMSTCSDHREWVITGPLLWTMSGL